METAAERIEWAMKARGLKKHHVEMAAGKSPGYLSTAFKRKANDLKRDTIAAIAAVLAIDPAWIADGGPAPTLAPFSEGEIQKIRRRKAKAPSKDPAANTGTDESPEAPPVPFAPEEPELVQDKPVPGTPTVVRTPRPDTLTFAPLGPTDAETPRFPRFSRTPGRILKLLRKLNPTPPILAAHVARNKRIVGRSSKKNTFC